MARSKERKQAEEILDKYIKGDISDYANSKADFSITLKTALEAITEALSEKKKKKKGKFNYVMQAQYHHEIHVNADDIFEATHKAIDKLEKLEKKEGFTEQRGSDLSMRIWHEYP